MINMRKFLLVGRTGVGKSSFVNATFGKHLAKTDSYEACTSVVEHYAYATSMGDICLIDTPGLGEDEDCETDKNYISLVKSQVNMSQIDAIIYVTRLNETRFRGEEKKILKLLIESFDSRLWQSAWLVFTFSASVLPLERDKVTQKRKEQIESHVKDCLLAKGAKTFQGFTVKLRVDNIKRNWAENSTSVISILAK
jgi:GTPase Era involved in 16S rRNA processing